MCCYDHFFCAWIIQIFHYSDSLLSVRQSLVAAKISSLPTTNDLCGSLNSTLKTSVDKATNQLQVIPTFSIGCFKLYCSQEVVKPDVNFSQRSFTEFREEFCMKNVRQGMVVSLLEFVLDTASVSYILCFIY